LAVRAYSSHCLCLAPDEEEQVQGSSEPHEVLLEAAEVHRSLSKKSQDKEVDQDKLVRAKEGNHHSYADEQGKG